MLETGIRGIENGKPPALYAPRVLDVRGGCWGFLTAEREVGFSVVGVRIVQRPDDSPGQFRVEVNGPLFHNPLPSESALTEPACEVSAGVLETPGAGIEGEAQTEFDGAGCVACGFHRFVVSTSPKRGQVLVVSGSGFVECPVKFSRGRAGVSGAVGPVCPRHGSKPPRR